MMDCHDIQPGEEYTLRYTVGNREGYTLRVRADSGVWVNSIGIEGFHATLLDGCGWRDEGESHVIQTHLYDVVGQ